MSETLETATTPHANLDRRTFLKGRVTYNLLRTFTAA